MSKLGTPGPFAPPVGLTRPTGWAASETALGGPEVSPRAAHSEVVGKITYPTPELSLRAGQDRHVPQVQPRCGLKSYIMRSSPPWYHVCIATKPKPHPLVSVVIPTWNHEQLLRSCLESLQSQDYPDQLLEIVVSDDGSTDNTSVVVKEFQTKGKLAIIHMISVHGGVNSARNAGVTASSGDIVCFFDDDEVAPPSWVSAIVGFFSKYPDVDIVGGACRQFAPPRFRVCTSCSNNSESRAVVGSIAVPLGEGPLPENEPWFPLGGNQAVRRRIFDSVGLFDPAISGFGDETEWHLRAAAKGARFGVSPEMWIWHRRDSQGVIELMRKIFWQAYRGERYERARSTGQHRRPRSIIRSIVVSAGHSVHHRCGAGMILVAKGLGRLSAAAVQPVAFTASKLNLRERLRPRRAEAGAEGAQKP